MRGWLSPLKKCATLTPSPFSRRSDSSFLSTPLLLPRLCARAQPARDRRQLSWLHADPASHSAHASEKEAELSARKGAGEEGALHCIVIAFPDKGRERGVKRVVKEV